MKNRKFLHTQIMKRIVFFVLAIISFSMEIFSQNKTDRSINTLEEKIYGLSLIWSEVKYNFVNIDNLDFDLDSLYRETMKRVIETQDDVAYYKELSCFMNKLNDAHTELIDYPESGYEETDYPNYGTKYIDGKYYFIKYKKIVLILTLTYLVQKLLKLTDCLLNSM